MKTIINKIFIPILISVICGFICGKLVYEVYDSKIEEDIKGEKIYLIQAGAYDSYDNIPSASRLFIENAINDGDYEAMYQSVRQMESENKDILLQFQDEYPGVTNKDNVDDILKRIRKKMEHK